MATERLWVVRVVMGHTSVPAVQKMRDEGLLLLLQCLRYAGTVAIHRDDEDGMCWDLLPPRHINHHGNQTWAKMTASRMKSFGLNAVAAPEWKEIG